MTTPKSRPDGKPAPALESGPGPVVADDAALLSLPTASAAAGPVVASLGEAAAALGAGTTVIPVPAGGPGVGADRIAEPERGTVSVSLDPRTADPRGPIAGIDRGGPLGDRDTTIGAGRILVDPDDVPGTRRLEALTNIKRDDRTFVPGDEIELDFRGYEELVAIGAVAPIDWRTGERIRIAPSPGAPRY